MLHRFRHSSARASLAALAVIAALLLPTRPAFALFHLAVIDEIMTSYAGDDSAQFVEIRIVDDIGGQFQQRFVSNSVLGAFDVDGFYLGDVLIVPNNIENGNVDDRWIMATAAFQSASAILPDFTIPAGLPVGGGMVCWGAPGAIPPDPTTWDHSDPDQYIDCVTYGAFKGDGTSHTGTPNPAVPNGSSLQRTGSTDDDASDFACTAPTPENNAGFEETLAQTSPCFLPGLSPLEVRMGALPPIVIFGDGGGSATLMDDGKGGHLLEADASIWKAIAFLPQGFAPRTVASPYVTNGFATFREGFLAENPAGPGAISGFGGDMPFFGQLALRRDARAALIPTGTFPFVAGAAVITGIATDRVEITNGPRQGATGAPFTLELTPGEGTTVLSKGGIDAVTIFGDDGGIASAAPSVTLVTPMRVGLGRGQAVPGSISTEYNFVPEPATAALLGAAGFTLGLIAVRRMRS